MARTRGLVGDGPGGGDSEDIYTAGRSLHCLTGPGQGPVKRRPTQGSPPLPPGKGIFITCSICVAWPMLGG